MPYFSVSVRQIIVDTESPEEARKAAMSEPPYLSWTGSNVEVVAADHATVLSIR